MGKPVIGLESWDLGECPQESTRIVQAKTPLDAVDLSDEAGALEQLHVVGRQHAGLAGATVTVGDGICG
jgi:hypothetical protein